MLCNEKDLYIYTVLTCSGNQSPKLGSGELWDMQLSNPQQHMDKQGEGNKGWQSTINTLRACPCRLTNPQLIELVLLLKHLCAADEENALLFESSSARATQRERAANLQTKHYCLALVRGSSSCRCWMLMLTGLEMLCRASS